MKRNLPRRLTQACLLTLFFTGLAQAQTATPVSITAGFNQDIIANGIGNASASTTQSFDQTNTRALLSLDFQATASSSLPTYGLPANGSITSATNSGVTFQIADYSSNNALFLTPSYVNNGLPDTGTLSFSATGVQTLYVLAATAGGGLSTVPVTATVNFSDNTTQVVSINVSDWYNGLDYAIQGIGRVNTSNNNLEGAYNNPRLYQVPITLSTANFSKTVTGITFYLAGSNSAEYFNEIRLSVLGVSIQAAPVVPTSVAVTTQAGPATITTNGGTLQLTAAVTPATSPQTVTWAITGGSTLATVSSTGLVTALDNGTVTVTATSTVDNTIAGTLTITITNQVVVALTPVTITAGFNQDIIANGVGSALTSSTIGFDETNSRALVSLDFQATASSAVPTYGLPANGTITSAVTDDVTFQLANYTGNNALFLTPSYVNNGAPATGTLAFSATNVYNLYILAGAAGGGLATLPISATVNFSDNTTQVTPISVSDWYDGTGYAIQGIGRVNRTNNNLEGSSTNPRLYEINLAINAANYSKTITGVTFLLNGDATAEYGSEIRASILAITTAAAPVQATVVTVTTQNNAPATITTDSGTLQLVATVTPTTQAVTWSITSATEFATVSATGLVTALANGTVTVTATTTGGQTDTIDIVVTNQVIEVTAVAISVEGDAPATITTNAGTLQLMADVTPADATTATVTWSITSGTGLATIDADGLVTALANGTVTVTATSSNGLTDTIEIVITNQVIEVTALTITTANNTAATIVTAGGTLQLVATVTPADATDTSVVWSITSGSEFATIDANGLVTAVANGTVTVTATSASGVTTTFTVIINIPTVGLDAINLASVSVYPNPTNGLVNITANQPVSFAVYNTLGQQVTAGKGNTINLQDAQQGVYFVQLTLENGAGQTVKVIKN